MIVQDEINIQESSINQKSNKYIVKLITLNLGFFLTRKITI